MPPILTQKQRWTLESLAAANQEAYEREERPRSGRVVAGQTLKPIAVQPYMLYKHLRPIAPDWRVGRSGLKAMLTRLTGNRYGRPTLAHSCWFGTSYFVSELGYMSLGMPVPEWHHLVSRAGDLMPEKMEHTPQEFEFLMVVSRLAVKHDVRWLSAFEQDEESLERLHNAEFNALLKMVREAKVELGLV